ncbi:MAG: tetratricopeptide repeat protein [Deltaproteobacteria bacterium]|nr:tetratricopeptide repeat protein [Deltaproteobacteria bacterium]
MKNTRPIQKSLPVLILGLMVLFRLSPAGAQEDLEREQAARHDLNYASYLIEVGKYMEALENYETALELTSRTQTKIDALLAKATLLSTFLDAPEEALKVYREVYRQIPPGCGDCTIPGRPVTLRAQSPG